MRTTVIMHLSVILQHFVLVVLFAVRMVYSFGTNNGRCERITNDIPMCVNMRYNLTKMPNFIGHTSQKEANKEILEFLPLVQMKCSPLLQFFLCSVYAPMCTEQVNEVLVIPACRSMCLEVKSKCEPILRRLELAWPDSLNCERLPVKSDMSGDLCMEAPSPDHPDLQGQVDNIPGYDMSDRTNWQRILDVLQRDKDFSTTQVPMTVHNKWYPYPCPDRFVYVDKARRNNSLAKCAPRCNIDVYFRQEDKRFAEVWMTIWASLCLISTLIAVLTFIQDTTRFGYPERPIIFLCVSYAVYSCAYIIRAIVGPTVISCETNSNDEVFLIQEGFESTWCTIVFLISYYFGMAACLWWVVLTFTWFLAAGRMWGSEAIQRRSGYFHMVAWAVPAVKTIIILARRRVDGEQLTGMCYVGNQDPSSLMIYVIVPLLLYLIIGAVFILAGFIALMRIRGELKQDTANLNIKKLEKLMAKIGIFSVLYIVPGICLTACLIYEYMNMQMWTVKAASTPCEITKTDEYEKTLDCSLPRSLPIIEVFLLKLFMYFAVGITSGMWVWSRKTVHSWSTLCDRIKQPQRKQAYPGSNPGLTTPASVPFTHSSFHGQSHSQRQLSMVTPQQQQQPIYRHQAPGVNTSGYWYKKCPTSAQTDSDRQTTGLNQII